MRTLYLECSMGAAGDMLTAALLELVDRDVFLRKIQSLDLPRTRISAETVTKGGIRGTKMNVRVNDHHHSHSTLNSIESIIDDLDISNKVKTDAKAVYRLIAEAESHVHGRIVEEIHFHEVGALDAVADVVGVCLLMEELAPEQVIASPVHVGSGHISCAHGVFPVPAPATAYLLRDIPIYGGQIDGELCTPTGAALLQYFADGFGNMPVMCTEKIGYGFGEKEFSQLNCVRAFLGRSKGQTEQIEKIFELKCNLDDMTPEQIGFAMEMLFEAGALDVFTTPLGMKKNRPAVLLTVLCKPDQREAMLREIFKHTSTLGIRVTACERYVLKRSETVRHTEYGDVRIKTANGYGVSKSKPEYEDIARLAKEHHLSLDEILDEVINRGTK